MSLFDQINGLRHTVMRSRIELRVFQSPAPAGRPKATKHEELKWATAGEWLDLPKSTTMADVAKLLAGEMPHDIERVFNQADVSLFPQKHDDLRTSCSCPDEANPCKHIAAVYYLLGEEFDRDPFLLFRLRGLDQLRHDRRIEIGKPKRKRLTARTLAGTTCGMNDAKILDSFGYSPILREGSGQIRGFARSVHADVFAFDIDDDDSPAVSSRLLDHHLGCVRFA